MPQSCARPRSLTTGAYIQDHPLEDTDVLVAPSQAFLAGPTTNVREYVHLSEMEAGLLSPMSDLLHPSPPEELEASRPTWMVSVGRHLFGALCMIYTLGIYRIFYVQLRFNGREGGMGRTNGPFDSTYAQWAKVVRRMTAIWRLARLGCAVLLPLSITLLQIDGVVNTVLSRTCTISTAVFAAAGLICSGIYLFLRNEIINSANKTRWIEASRVESSYAVQSVEFWTYLALPVASMVWGILTCAVTIVCIAWTHRSDGMEEPESAFIASAVFITSLIAITLVYVYKATGMVIWPHRGSGG